MYGTALALIPFLIVIPLSLLTRQVIPGLLIGLLAGAYMLHPSLYGGLSATLSYLLKELSLPSNLSLILFLYGFGAFVGLIRVTGGISGFAQAMTTRIRSVRSAYVLTWLSSLATFMAPDFRIITIAPIVRHVFTRLGIPSERVAYMIDLTSTPLCAVVPIGTAFVGYMIGLISTSMRHHSSGQTPYGLLLASLPFNVFAWLMLAWGLYVSFFHRSSSTTQLESAQTSLTKRPLQVIREKVRTANAFTSMEMGDLAVAPAVSKKVSKKPDDTFPDAVEMASESVKPSAGNLLFPLVVLLILTFFLTWWDGHAGASNFIQAFIHANAAKAMLEAVFLTLIISVIFYLFRGQSLARTMFGVIAGGNEMMSVIILLTLIWGVSAVSADLGFSQFTQREIVRYVPASLIVPALFVFGCAISYVIGSSFGTWAMLMPLGFSLAQGGAASLPLIAGAVFASGTFGGFASPLSDNTVAMSTVMKLPLMPYARLKTKSAVWIASVCTLIYAALGWGLI